MLAPGCTVVFPRVDYRLADLDSRCEVQESLYAVLPKNGNHDLPIGDVRFHEANSWRKSIPMSRRQVIHDDDGMASADQRANHVRPNVSGSSVSSV